MSRNRLPASRAWVRAGGSWLSGYALLRQLAGARPGNERSRRNLGVLWFLTVHPEANNDGRHRSYLTHDGYAALDPSLFSAMRLLERAVLKDGLVRSVDLLEDGCQGGDYLPGARFHASPLERIVGRGNAVPERRRAQDRKSTRLNSSHGKLSRMPSSA